jgi:hypothetical protein
MTAQATEPLARRLVREIRQRDRATEIEQDLQLALDELGTCASFLNELTEDGALTKEDKHRVALAIRCAFDAESAIQSALALHEGRD